MLDRHRRELHAGREDAAIDRRVGAQLALHLFLRGGDLPARHLPAELLFDQARDAVGRVLVGRNERGIEPALLAQFHPLEEALGAMDVAVWPMTKLEADDALASAAKVASENEGVQQICIWTPDKDLAQCVRGNRVVQVDRRSQKIRDAEGVREKFGVEPVLIPDFLALVGDTGATDTAEHAVSAGEESR